MRCPYCRNNQTKVVDTRESADVDITRRRRECLKCQKRFTTYERVETLDMVVVKKDGTREQFDRVKLKNGIMKSCEKRPIPSHRIETMLDSIESKLRRLRKKEIKSAYIGSLVMKHLKKLDEVAYVRFASVYREFKDANEFMSEIRAFVKRRH